MFNIKLKIELRHQFALLNFQPSIYTPDISRLEKYEYQLLFVCDDWMRARRGRHFIADDCEHQHVGFTMHGYRFLTHRGYLGYDADPVHIPLEDSTGYKIKGEVVRVRPSTFLKLDKLKLNGVSSHIPALKRRRVHILYPHRPWGVLENVLDESERLRPHRITSGLVLNGKIPDWSQHPLAGKKYWIGKERMHIMQTWMYVAHPFWWDLVYRHPEQFDEVARFIPNKPKRWLSEYYQYQNPKDR